jgi:Trk K+ transport system NAD-binding subunit
MVEVLEAMDQAVTVVDVHPERVAARPGSVLGRGTEASTLEEAGVRKAVGVIAGTGDDVDNLSIILTARELNDDLFFVARQERPQNDQLFDNSGADLIARPSVIVGRRILALATTPLLKTFLDHIEGKQADESFAERARRDLERSLGDYAPNVWVTHVAGPNAAGLRAANEEGVTLKLDHLLHNTRSGKGEDLRCVCLVLDRGDQARYFLPNADTEIQEGDRMLFAGRSSARREITRALQDPVLLLDYATPQRIPRTAVGRWLARRGAGQVNRG